MFVLINAITSWCEAAFPFGVDQMYQISSCSTLLSFTLDARLENAILSALCNIEQDELDLQLSRSRGKQFIPLRLSVVMFWLCFQMVWQVTNFANFSTSDYTNTAFAWPLVLRPPKYPTVTHNVPFKWTATCLLMCARNQRGSATVLWRSLFGISIYLASQQLYLNSYVLTVFV